MIKKRLKQLMALFVDILLFVKMKYFEKKSTSEKVLFVNFENPNLYHRFFYLLLKFYQIEGYKIIYPMGFSKFRNLRNGEFYLSLILKEKSFLSIKHKLPENYTEIKDSDFGANYFKNYFFEDNKEKKCFHIPMSFHPLMYHKNIWKENIDCNKERLNSVFCFGNFDDLAYSEIKKTPFNVKNRVELLSFFSKKEDFISIKKSTDFEQLFNQKEDSKFVFSLKKNHQIPIEEVRNLLSKFKFYLCCPGVVMPLCHNVIEAMSVGTVPIIQKEYAEVMYPNLIHKKNAIIFKNLEELNQIIENQIFNYSEAEFNEFKKNVLQYYQDFLTPNVVVNNINDHLKNSIIYLNAEHRSIDLLNKKI